MPTTTLPDLMDDTTEAEIESALARVRSSEAPPVSPAKRRRLRELLSPKANGDQDTW